MSYGDLDLRDFVIENFVIGYFWRGVGVAFGGFCPTTFYF